MDKIRWALVGAGTIAHKRVGPAIAAEPRSSLAAVVDTDAARARELAGTLGCPRAVSDIDEIISDQSIDAVYLATPVFLHARQATACLQAGKHVLCEKPLALNYEEARRLAAIRPAGRVKAGAAYFRRFYPAYRQAADMLARGEFGQVTLIRLAYHSWVEVKPESPLYWRMRKGEGGGGVLADMGSHMFDVMIGLFGLPETVFARVETKTFSYEIEDSAAMVMEYRNGPLVTASFNWNSKTWTHEFEIIGTEAKVRWYPYDGGKVIRTVGRDAQELALPNHENVHYPLIEDFVSAVLEDRAPAVTLAEAAKTNRLLDAVFLSGAGRREVPLAEVAP